MAKNRQPVLKRCKTLGLSPAVLGYSKETRRNPKQMRRKQSEYGLQLNEKQKVKFIYGVLEKQFHAYYEKAERKNGVTGEILLQELERRLDNVAYRMGFASSRREARQLVGHGHFTVNGHRVNIPSFQVKPGDVVAVCEKSRNSTNLRPWSRSWARTRLQSGSRKKLALLRARLLPCQPATISTMRSTSN